MKYLQIIIQGITSPDTRDLIEYQLGDEGPFDSFEETPDGFKAYIEASKYSETYLRETLAEQGVENYTMSVQEMPDVNWNAQWDSSHAPVQVEDFAWIYPDGAEPRPDIQYNIAISSSMTFGTAHHPTTYLMLQLIHDLDLNNQAVADMGCGTGVLALFAALRGASPIYAVDNDPRAVDNTILNARTNHLDNVITTQLGDANLLKYAPAQSFRCFIANINRNILVHDMGLYTRVIQPGGYLLLSGFFTSDIQHLIDATAPRGFRLVKQLERDNWAALCFEYHPEERGDIAFQE